MPARADQPTTVETCNGAGGAARAVGEAAYRRGLALHATGNPGAAVPHYLRALAAGFVTPECLNNAGCALRDTGRPENAVDLLQECLRRAPRHAGAHSNLGNAQKDLGRLDEAERSCRAALAIAPDRPGLHFNLGAVLQALERDREAAVAYRAELALDPDNARAHYNLAEACLRLGRLDEGFCEMEWRFRSGRVKDPLAQRCPRWSGEPLAGRTVLLDCEQGLGDALHFVRYAPLIAQRGGRVVIRVYPALERLMRRVAGIAAVVPTTAALPAADLYLPMLSAPHVLGTTLDTVPAEMPYLTADPDDVRAWRERLAPHDGLRVGLVWAGAPRQNDPDAQRIDKRRSIGLAAFATLAGIPGVTLVSLQKGPPAAQLESPPPGLVLIDPMGDVGDFADTAALIENLDLVVSVDTSVAHLAGGLGKPVWILSRFDGCWRWLIDRDDSPWYPTARLFRQQRSEDWSGAVGRLAAALRVWAQANRDVRRPA
ncbi:MAG: tetratricopeptide repeat protein [Rhodoplanes sp.]|uniref:tetratricopeptide repeat protein n=1 Tax=Rhodoplanes sp. TaxID=1968906 RepID=UPI0017F871CC|nr:tetratricopeptide repeat protein [Rhodoplanes sp.]NVO17759.1 tetratricopeptide repeat protein [Rhodoplanes sp.]